MIIDKAMREKLRALRNEKAIKDGIITPGSIVFLEQKLQEIDDPYIQDEILSEIAGEYARAEMYEQWLETNRLRLSKHPNEVLLISGLADTLSFSSLTSHQNEARDTIVEAVKAAKTQNLFLRDTLAEQARIAVRIGDSSLYQDALKQLTEDALSNRKFDVDSGFWPNIVEELPDSFCPQELIDAYIAAISIK